MRVFVIKICVAVSVLVIGKGELCFWSASLTIELQKTERGLGFSILDYQDPLNPSETVIVIRSLVPGGVAQQDGKITIGSKIFF